MDQIMSLQQQSHRTNILNAWPSRLGIVAWLGCGLWVLGIALPVAQSQIAPPQTDVAASTTRLQVITSSLPNGTQQVLVVEPNSKTLALYHIDPSQGLIQLKSVRRIAWDLTIEEFNGQPPLPRDIRAVQP
ncbi:MAG: hypothetical protein KatS3mg111_2780 [Pirellulaceae bacterium]|nr:MAG: hypothetical protein KatS3mg111_2780 [Pirellulaceae bacterium]